MSFGSFEGSVGFGATSQQVPSENDDFFFPPEISIHYWGSDLKDPDAFSNGRICSRFYFPCIESFKCCLFETYVAIV